MAYLQSGDILQVTFWHELAPRTESGARFSRVNRIDGLDTVLSVAGQALESLFTLAFVANWQVGANRVSSARIPDAPAFVDELIVRFATTLWSDTVADISFLASAFVSQVWNLDWLFVDWNGGNRVHAFLWWNHLGIKFVVEDDNEIINTISKWTANCFPVARTKNQLDQDQTFRSWDRTLKGATNQNAAFFKASNQSADILKMQYSDWWRLLESDSGLES